MSVYHITIIACGAKTVLIKFFKNGGEVKRKVEFNFKDASRARLRHLLNKHNAEKSRVPWNKLFAKPGTEYYTPAAWSPSWVSETIASQPHQQTEGVYT